MEVRRVRLRMGTLRSVVMLRAEFRGLVCCLCCCRAFVVSDFASFAVDVAVSPW
jgi:hypothetical protein